MVAVEPDCSSAPVPQCEREGEYVLDVVEEGACCPKKICGELYQRSESVILANYFFKIPTLVRPVLSFSV